MSTTSNEIRGPRELCGSRVVVIVGTHPQAIPLAMITMAKLIHWFSFLSHMSIGLCMAALWAAGAMLKCSCFYETQLKAALIC